MFEHSILLPNAYWAAAWRLPFSRYLAAPTRRAQKKFSMPSRAELVTAPYPPQA